MLHSGTSRGRNTAARRQPLCSSQHSTETSDNAQNHFSASIPTNLPTYRQAPKFSEKKNDGCRDPVCPTPVGSVSTGVPGGVTSTDAGKDKRKCFDMSNMDI